MCREGATVAEEAANPAGPMVRPERPSPSLPLPAPPPPLQPRGCISKAGASCQPCTPICTHTHAHTHRYLHGHTPARTHHSCSSCRALFLCHLNPLCPSPDSSLPPHSHPLPETPARPPALADGLKTRTLRRHSRSVGLHRQALSSLVRRARKWTWPWGPGS